MKKMFLALAASLSLTFSAAAQCEDCKANTDTRFDYCYLDKNFEGYCAQFKEGDNQFFLVKKGKSRTVLYSEKPSLEFLIRVSNSKKLKLTALEVLFLQAAIQQWELERRRIGFEFASNGLGVKITRDGDGPKPEPGQTVVAHYTGYLQDGTKFDSSVDRNQPFEFAIGQGAVIKGWDEGFAKLKKGTKAVLYIPAELGYGDRGAGRVIPPKADLIFEVELIDIK